MITSLYTTHDTPATPLTKGSPTEAHTGNDEAGNEEEGCLLEDQHQTTQYQCNAAWQKAVPQHAHALEKGTVGPARQLL